MPGYTSGGRSGGSGDQVGWRLDRRRMRLDQGCLPVARLTAASLG
ncbi:hypothetical protein ACFFX0_20085 [Citricoccus parietis]|uniref:Uncharacterized protein n=1 Tax=Citricoccus parietis TaxID=592307 RepID=A0ABV5G365_9MICC